MNKFILILSMMLISFSCNQIKKSAYIHNDLFFDNLKGSVEKVEETNYTLDTSYKIISPDSCCKSIIYYDNKGYRIRYSTIENNGHEKNAQAYTSRFPNGMVKELKFIENGKLISILSSTLNNSGSYGDSQIYDSAGKLISFYSEILVNKFGKIISWKNFNPDNTLQETVVNNYSNNIWIGGYIRDNAGKKIFSTIIRLNENKDELEMEQSKELNGLMDTIIIKYVYDVYDKNGNWIQRTEINKKDKSLKLTKRQIIYRNY